MEVNVGNEVPTMVIRFDREDAPVAAYGPFPSKEKADGFISQAEYGPFGGDEGFTWECVPVARADTAYRKRRTESEREGRHDSREIAQARLAWYLADAAWLRAKTAALLAGTPVKDEPRPAVPS